MKTYAKILSLLLIVLIAVSTTACNEKEPENSEKTFLLEVVDIDENVTTLSVTTTEATVGAALFEAEIIDNADFVTVVNGVRADFVEDGYWWQFFVDGEASMVGVGRTEIEEGRAYAFIYTKA